MVRSAINSTQTAMRVVIRWKSCDALLKAGFLGGLQDMTQSLQLLNPAEVHFYVHLQQKGGLVSLNLQKTLSKRNYHCRVSLEWTAPRWARHQKSMQIWKISHIEGRRTCAVFSPTTFCIGSASIGQGPTSFVCTKAISLWFRLRSQRMLSRLWRSFFHDCCRSA